MQVFRLFLLLMVAEPVQRVGDVMAKAQVGGSARHAAGHH